MIREEVFLAFCGVRPSRMLLPNLHYININFNCRFFHPQTPQLLFGPTLTSLHIEIDYPGTCTASQLVPLTSSILHNSPNIQHFTLSSYSCPSTEVESFAFGLISNSHNLQTISLPELQLTRETIAHLARLPSLTVLKSVLIPRSDVGLFPVGVFPYLKTFSVELDDWESAITILDSLSCAFESFTVRCYAVLEPLSMLQDFMGKLALLSSSLITIDLRGDHMERFSQSNTVKSVTDLIRPLFSCNRLQVVSLTFPFLYLLEDSELEAAALAWTLLEKLRLCGGKWGDPRATCKGLASLLRHCPKLKKVALHLDTRTFESSLLKGVRNASVKHLEFFHPVQVDADRKIRAALRGAFPGLRYLFHGTSTQIVVPKG